MFLTDQAKSFLDSVRYPKLLTLTLAHTDDPVEDQISRLYKSFQKFRKRKIFEQRVAGGIWFFQLKRSKLTGEWHPHLHVLISGKFMLQSELSRVWKSVTGDSSIIDIRAVPDNEKAAKHIARYATLPADLTLYSDDDAVTLISAMKGRRLVGTFGTAKEMSLKQVAPADSGKWEIIGTWNFIVELIGQSVRADAIWNAFSRGESLPAGYSLKEIEREVCNEHVYENKPPPLKQLNFFSEAS